MRGENHHARVSIELEDNFSGATRAISLRVPELTEDGRVTLRERTLNVRIPKGIRPGQQIRLAGQGGLGFGGAASGDLYVVLQVAAGRQRSRQGTVWTNERPTRVQPARDTGGILIP
jgi:curved DNA-binding protein